MVGEDSLDVSKCVKGETKRAKKQMSKKGRVEKRVDGNEASELCWSKKTTGNGGKRGRTRRLEARTRIETRSSLCVQRLEDVSLEKNKGNKVCASRRDSPLLAGEVENLAAREGEEKG